MKIKYITTFIVVNATNLSHIKQMSRMIPAYLIFTGL